MAALTVARAADFDFGPVGITSIENLRIAAFCLSDARSEGCQVEFHFHSRNGAIVRESSAVLTGETGAMLDFRLPDGTAPGRRGEIVPCVRVIRGSVASNIQVFDIYTGRTRIFRNWGDRPVALSGEIHFGHLGLTGGDTARIGALCQSTGATAASGCDVTFIFHDNQGRVLKESSVSLAPGASASADFRTAEAALPARRVEIIPCIRPGRGAVISSLESFDTLSGLGLLSTHAAASLVP